ncbi:uncharacterized protein LOC128709453 [Anopheles marshallii]|uniref:uncharacterized protein LOC128709453 n=1 Tax=Anopheles marshallii TaxID=1521116 RepID=UPI00237A9E2B|nr:uncharacterized protein LOC128709453 [Anopheles marshallii]
MPAMANRFPPPSLSSPSALPIEPPQSTLSSRTISPSPSSLSGAGVAPQAEISRPQPVAVTSRAGTVVCGLIGKFECTRSDTADVKVTANSCRASDNALITSRGCPITCRSSPTWGTGETEEFVGFREIVTGNRNECSDKTTTTTTMGVGGTGGRLGQCSGEMVNSEMDACVHRTRERQRKTVVYSRLCLDDALLDDVGLLESDAHKTNASTGQHEPTDATGQSVRRSTGQAEVIRFPCVERLIELYANIIRQKEAEVQRFMSSIVRNGDKRRLDKALSSSADGRRRRATEDGSHGSKLQQGDIRKEPSLPASVSLESLSRTKTLQATDLVGDRMRTSSVQSIDEVVRAGRTKESSSPAQSDEGWRSSTQPSSYGSSDEEERPVQVEEEPRAENMKNRDKVTRSSSSDSALGLDDDLSQQEQQQMIATVGKVRRLTLGVSDIPLRSALLPVPEPSTLPSLTTVTSDHCPTVVRSKMILEAQLIELPLVDGNGGSSDQSGQQQLGCPPSNSVSRRESAQSYISDLGEGVRYVRTPSVVVSDYSDDTMCGITLEEIEYFRRHRLRRGSADCESDISAASSCSNLNYCGSSISALDGCEYQCGLRTPERKVSDCSTCSTVSCEEDEGYSVVRSKLASLSLPSNPVPEEPESSPKAGEPPVISSPHVNRLDNAGAATEDTSTETGDVRVCSKKKVSHESEHSG